MGSGSFSSEKICLTTFLLFEWGSTSDMAYDHARKAGNRGDVWKHFGLVSLAEEMTLGEVCRYDDLHAGAPIHQLLPGGEWEKGIGEVLRRCSLQHPYFATAKAFVQERRYPAGWMLIAGRLATRCRVVEVHLADLAEGVATRYNEPLPKDVPANVNVRFEQSDGFTRVANLDGSDLVFIDPPFHPKADADWRALTAACKQLSHRRICFVAWYPIYSPTRPQKLVDTTGCSAWEVIWARCGPKPSQNLKGCGMLASTELAPIFKRIEVSLSAVASCMGGELKVRSPRPPNLLCPA